MQRLPVEEIARIEQELLNSSVDVATQTTIKGIIAGQVLLIDQITNLLESSGSLRTKIMRELAKIIEVPFKKNSPEQAASSSQAAPSADSTASTGQEKQEEKPSSDPAEGSEENSEKAAPKKKHPKRGNGEFRPNVSHLHFHAGMEPGDLCPACLKGKVYFFREKVIPILIGRSPLVFEEHRLQTLRCNGCGKTFDPQVPKELFSNKGMPSAQAILTVLHYQLGLPFASISALQEMANQQVSPSQLWKIIEETATAIQPIYEEMQGEAANASPFYSDDTSARILSHYPQNKVNRTIKKRKKAPEGRVATYSSTLIGCTPEGHKITLFYHGRKYAGENLAELLRFRDPLLDPPLQMKDASTMNVPPSTRVVESKCNAHAIRKFKDLQLLYPKECHEILTRYREISRNEENFSEKDEEERLQLHKEHSLPLMEKIKEYVQGLIENRRVEPNSSFGSAISYFLSHYTGLSAFCYFKGAPFTNNEAERALKMVIRLRKTSMFYKTERGAQIASSLHSVLYTAQEAGVNVLFYLQLLLQNQEEVRQNPQAFLPWRFQAEDKAEDQGEAVEANQLAELSR